LRQLEWRDKDKLNAKKNKIKTNIKNITSCTICTENQKKKRKKGFQKLSNSSPKLSKSCQILVKKVVKKLPKSCQKVVKKLSKKLSVKLSKK
jgi:hypothetical protein